jgi:hypothetical protein
MRVAVLAVASVMVLPLGGSEAAKAQDSSLTPPSMTAKAAPEQSVNKQVTSRVKKDAKASPDLERVDSPDRDPLLGVLWLLTGSSRRR